MVKLRDFLRLQVNKANNQKRLEVRSKKLKESNLRIDDILDLEMEDKFSRKWQRLRS